MIRNSLIIYLISTLFIASNANSQESSKYLQEVDSLPNPIYIRKYDERILCDRLKLWYLDFQSTEYLKKLGGRKKMSNYLSGDCISDVGEFQVGLVGKKNKLAYSYMISIRKPDEGLYIQYDPIGEKSAKSIRNSKIILYHLLTGILKEEYLVRN